MSGYVFESQGYTSSEYVDEIIKRQYHGDVHGFPAIGASMVVPVPQRNRLRHSGAFVILQVEPPEGEDVVATLRNHVGKDIGPIAKPRHILVVPELPKTRSGKIMRRLLKDVAEGREVGDATTLADNTVMTQIAESKRG